MGGVVRRIYKLLSNPIYVGRIAHKGQVHEGQHPPIVDQDLWDRVQQSLREHLGSARTKRTRQSSEALLAGKLFDDRGNRMSPTWARKGSKRWRYYVSQAALQGDKSKAGSIVRVPAAEVEALVTEAVGKLSADRRASQADLRDRIDRVVIGGMAIANARAILIEALGNAHRWLDELLSDSRQTLETLASREGKTERSIRMTVSLAFLAPDIVKAAVEGRLPRGYGLKRLIDLPLAWSDQWRTLGLETPARA